MGGKYNYGTPDRVKSNDSANNDFTVKTSHGRIRLSIDSREQESGGFPDPWTAATAIPGIASAGGIEIDPYNANAKRPGLWIWLGYPGSAAYHGKSPQENDEEIHIVHKGNNITGDCKTATGMPEILIDKENIYMYAPKKILMKYGKTDYSAHMLKDANAAGEAASDETAIIEGSEENVQITHEKQLHIYIKQDNLTGSSEIAMYESKMDITASKLTLSGDGGSPHGIGNAMVLSPSRVDMIGTYAEPDNQYHMYARFG